MAVTLKAKFNRDTAEHDGLGAVSDQLVADPLQPVVVIGVVQVTNTDENHLVGGLKTPKARFTSLEVMTGENETTARKMLEDAYHARTGQYGPPPTLFDTLTTITDDNDGTDDDAPSLSQPQVTDDRNDATADDRLRSDLFSSSEQ